MVERLLAIDDHRARCALTVRDNNPFIDARNELPGWVGVELMAQAIALFAGYHCLLRDEAVRVGYLLGSRQYSCHTSAFGVGSELLIEIEQEYHNEGMGLFYCRILHGDTELASARLNTYQAPLSNE